jgi:hypothetical protein
MSSSARPASMTDAHINFEELLSKLKGERTPSAARIEHSRFEIDGVVFDVKRVAQKEKQRFLITARLGYLPFSIESTERRDAIKTIVTATRILLGVRFKIDAASKISAEGLFDIDRLASPDFIFYPLMLFMQEAGPFINLIGKYLHEPAVAPAIPVL